jgi:hypothetical protein
VIEYIKTVAIVTMTFGERGRSHPSGRRGRDLSSLDGLHELPLQADLFITERLGRRRRASIDARAAMSCLDTEEFARPRGIRGRRQHAVSGVALNDGYTAATDHTLDASRV